MAASWQDSAGVPWNVFIHPREIDHEKIPPDIDADGEGPWKIVLSDMSDDAEEFTTQDNALGWSKA